MWELDCEESWVPKNWRFWTVVLEKTLESPFDCKAIQPIHPKGDQSWVFTGRTDVEAETPTLVATSCEELTHWKRPWCWECLEAGGEGDNRGWDGWVASLTWWTWVWVNSRTWWWKGRPGVLWFMESQRAGHGWATELNSTERFVMISQKPSKSCKVLTEQWAGHEEESNYGGETDWAPLQGGCRHPSPVSVNPGVPWETHGYLFEGPLQNPHKTERELFCFSHFPSKVISRAPTPFRTSAVSSTASLL